MEIVKISKKAYKELEYYDEGFEGCLYILELKNRWNKEKKLLKELYQLNDKTFSNKLLTISTLINYKHKLSCDELVLPEKLAVVGSQVMGFTMPYIESISLYDALKSDIPTKEKIEYLKGVGSILRKLEDIRKYSGFGEIYLGDIHEKNFIIDKDRKVKAIDLDSAKIKNNQPFPSRYLYTSSGIGNFPSKYPSTEYGINIANEDSDLYCYITLILNFISGIDTSKLSLKEFYNYIQFLSDKGISKEFLDTVEIVYSNKKNENPDIYLDELPKCLEKYKYDKYLKISK